MWVSVLLLLCQSWWLAPCARLCRRGIALEIRGRLAGVGGDDVEGERTAAPAEAFAPIAKRGMTHGYVIAARLVPESTQKIEVTLHPKKEIEQPVSNLRIGG